MPMICGRRTFNSVAQEYSDITTDYAHVDATCMWLVKNPEWFDVIVTDNMFGDIITDLGGHDPGRSRRRGRRQHQSRGRLHVRADGRQRAEIHRPERDQPDRRHRRRQMMLEFLGEDAAAGLVEKAIVKVVSKDMKSMAAGKMGHSTSQIGDLVADYVAKA